MALTPEQRATLRADIAADPTLSTLPHNSSSAETIAAAYNEVASPEYWVWRTMVRKTEYLNTMSVAGTTFIWVGNGFITRSAGEQTAWHEMFGEGTEANVNPSLLQVRQAFQDIFSGAGNAAANRTHLLTLSRRLATRLEVLFATGTGTPTAPGTMEVEGLLTLSDADTTWSD